MRTAARHRQKGTVIITAAFFTLFLLGFIGIALDFGRLFIVKTELQTAMDSCALAAAHELDGAADALQRATNAGKTAGNLNKIHFQGASAGLLDEEVTFSNTLTGAYSHTFMPVANAKYARCTRTKSDMAPLLLQALSGWTGDAAFSALQSVSAMGVATRTPAQTSCALPVRINPRNSTPPNYGFVPGEWIATVYDESPGTSNPSPGSFGWANLDGNTRSGAELKDEVRGTGVCNISVDTPVTNGAKFSAAAEWNSRFGLYKGGGGPSQPNIDNAPPDLTGFAYTKDGAKRSWPEGKNAIADFLLKRASNRSYGNTVDSITAGDALTGLNIKGGYKDNDMGTYAAGPRALATKGGDRRLVLAPIVGSSKIDAFACVLILHPIDSTKTTVYLEYVGNASNPGSPCTTSGLPGGTGGALVPVLVQ